MERVLQIRKGGNKYGLEEEKFFIDHLGKWSKKGREMGRMELLRRYRSAIGLRVDWDELDKLAVQQYVQACIERAAVMA